jgi:hypothetical protein
VVFGLLPRALRPALWLTIVVEGNDVQLQRGQMQRLHSVGIISVRLRFIQNVRRIYQPTVSHASDRLLGQIPENALKGQTKSHQTGYFREESPPAHQDDTNLTKAGSATTVLDMLVRMGFHRQWAFRHGQLQVPLLGSVLSTSPPPRSY